ncbi:MAG: DUF4924 family protein [Bacteroidota bacterium]
MFIAREKKRSNIAEYVLYMWQIEDLIRSCQFDREVIAQRVIAGFDYPEEQKQQLAEWYDLLIKKMQDQEIVHQGHLKELRDLLNELMYLHMTLLNTIKDENYAQLYQQALPNINALREKSNAEFHEIETCFNGVYGYLVLKLRQSNVTKDTTEAVASFTQLLAYLSGKYREMKAGKSVPG